MINNLLEIVAREDGNYYFNGAARGLGEALIYALTGFVIVFVGIVLIIAVIWLLGLLMRKTDNFAFLSRRGKKNKKEKVAEPVAESVADDEIPDEIKAAIVAALMAYYTVDKPKCEFKVKRIKRI